MTCNWDEQFKDLVLLSSMRKHIRNNKISQYTVVFFFFNSTETVGSEHLTVDAELTLVKFRNKLLCMSCQYMTDLILPTAHNHAAEIWGCPIRDKYMASKNVQFYVYWHKWSFLYSWNLKTGKIRNRVHIKCLGLVFFFLTGNLT